MEGWKGYTECHRQGGALSAHFRQERPCLPYSPCSFCLPQCQRPGRPHVTHSAHPFRSAWVNRDRTQCLHSVGRAGPFPLMARQPWVVIRQGKCSVCLLLPLARTPLIGDSRVPKSKQTSLQDKHGPRRSSWHRRPKFAGLMLGKVCRGWPPALALLQALSHSCPARCACACHGVVIAEEVPRRRRCRRKASAPKLPLTSDRAGTDRQDPSTARRRSGSSNRVVRLQCTAPSRHPQLEPIHN